MRLSGIIGSLSVCLMFSAVGDLEAQANELGSRYFGQKGLGDYVKIWDSASGSSVSGNPGGASDHIQTIPEGWNEWTDVNLAYQIHYYVNYNWTDNADRFLTVTAKLYEDDVIGNDLIGTRSVELYARGMGSYTSGLHYYIGPNGWIAKLDDGTVVGKSISSLTPETLGYFWYNWPPPHFLNLYQIGTAEFFAHVTVQDNNLDTVFDGEWNTNALVPYRRPDLEVVRPSTNQVWYAGQTMDIIWTSDWYNHPEGVNLHYSVDGGASWSPIAIETTNDNLFNWQIPLGINSSNCKIMAITPTPGYNSTYFDHSGAFSIVPQPSNSLAVSKMGSGSGTIISSPVGIYCGDDCQESYSSGTTVTLTAYPANGSTFAGWSGACSGTGTCTVVITGTKSVEATFNSISHSLQVSKAGGGSGIVTSNPSGINCGTDCQEDYNHGATVTLTPSPDAGSTFAGWDGPCERSGTCTVTMTVPRTAIATFGVEDRHVFSNGFEEGNTERWSYATEPAVEEELTVYLPGGVPLELVRIPAGTFMMGSPSSERGRENREDLHEVTLTKDYFIGKYEVTQTQWEAVMGTNPAYGNGVGPDNPVYRVTWRDVAGPEGFIDTLNGLLGTTSFRLPTEAEWERAARAGTQTRFSHGDVLECGDECESCAQHDDFMWWCENSGSNTHPVGSKQPNGYGLYDMHGNLWEFVQDFWVYSLGFETVTDPVGPSSGYGRTARGGWNGWAKINRSASRLIVEEVAPPNQDAFGFRLAMDVLPGN